MHDRMDATWAERADQAIRAWHQTHGTFDPNTVHLTWIQRIQLRRLERCGERLGVKIGRRP